MLAAGVLMTAPGAPMIFMGQEMLEDTKFDPQPAPLDGANAASNAQVRAFYKDMIRLRRNLDGVSAGLTGKNVAMTQLNDGSGNKVLVYRRWNVVGDDAMVIANFGAKKYTSLRRGCPFGRDLGRTRRLRCDQVRRGLRRGGSDCRGGHCGGA